LVGLSQKGVTIDYLTNNNVVVIGGLGRTGGSLLAFVMDGGPDCRACSIEHPVINGGLDVDLATISDVSHFKERFVKRALVRHDALSRFDKSYQRCHFDYDVFEAKIETIYRSSPNLKTVHANVLNAWLGVRDGRDCASDEIIFNHDGRAFFYPTDTLLTNFGLRGFIYTRRNSIEWLISFALHHGNMITQRWFLEQALYIKLKCDLLAEFYQQKFPEKFLIIDYHKLVTNPENTTKNICQFFGKLQAGEYWREATYLGSPVRSNSNLISRDVKGVFVKPNSLELIDHIYPEFREWASNELNRISTMNTSEINDPELIHRSYKFLTQVRSKSDRPKILDRIKNRFSRKA